MEVCLSHLISTEDPPPPLTQTKKNMEKSVRLLAAVIFLGGFSDATGETTASSSSSMNWTRSSTVSPQGPSRHGQTAGTRAVSTAGKHTQLEAEDISRHGEQGQDQEAADKETRLGRTRLYHRIISSDYIIRLYHQVISTSILKVQSELLLQAFWTQLDPINNCS